MALNAVTLLAPYSVLLGSSWMLMVLFVTDSFVASVTAFVSQHAYATCGMSTVPVNAAEPFGVSIGMQKSFEYQAVRWQAMLVAEVFWLESKIPPCGEPLNPNI